MVRGGGDGSFSCKNWGNTRKIYQDIE